MIIDLSRRWMDNDLPCRQDPELFFTDHGANLKSVSDKVRKQWAKAKEVCADCPFIAECARDGLGETDGVWGGLDPIERQNLRGINTVRIRRMEGPRKQEYAAAAYALRDERKLPSMEVARLMGISLSAVSYLCTWHATWLKEQAANRAKVTDLELPESATVTEIHPNAAFPERAPANGDAWVRYGRRVVAGHYVGQTEDDAWFHFRLKLVGGEYSPCWIKAKDVKMTREMPRNVVVRSGSHGSRIYGNHLSRARSATG